MIGMDTFAQTGSAPLSLTRSGESKVYGLFAVAMALTLLGIYVGSVFSSVLLGTGVSLVLLFVELGLILSAPFWSRHAPWNYLLFGAFPILSGITLTPYILYVATGYVNGTSILMNAVSATACMALAAAVVARMTSWNLGAISRALFMGLIGLLLLGVLQIFVPSLRTGTFELVLSGAGVLLFSAFLAYDLQRVQASARVGANPFLLALSLYLDLFNLFLYVLRFMTALSGDRR